MKWRKGGSKKNEEKEGTRVCLTWAEYCFDILGGRGSIASQECQQVGSDNLHIWRRDCLPRGRARGRAEQLLRRQGGPWAQRERGRALSSPSCIWPNAFSTLGRLRLPGVASCGYPSIPRTPTLSSCSPRSLWPVLLWEPTLQETKLS